MPDGALSIQGSQSSSAKKVYSRDLLDKTREIQVRSSIDNKVCRKQSFVHAIKKAVDIVEGEQCDIIDFSSLPVAKLFIELVASIQMQMYALSSGGEQITSRTGTEWCRSLP